MNFLAAQLTPERAHGNNAMAFAQPCAVLHCSLPREGDTRTGFTQADAAPILVMDVLL